MNPIYPIMSVIVVSLISLIAAVPLLLKKKLSERTLLFLLSMSVGVLLSTVFLNFLPEIFEHEYHLSVGLVILLGFFLMFILEKLVHWHHSKKCEHGECGHGHAYNLAPINLIGDGIHNFIDGLVIAGAYSVNIVVGLVSTVSIIFHEVPQEIADFGVLLYSGMSKKKAIVFNFLSALTSLIGVIVGLLLVNKLHGFTEFVIPFAAGNFIYIAASNLTPQLHRHCGMKDSLIHLVAILLGILIVVLMTVYGPVHLH
jgi:zinc and cadmium transporter